MNLIISKRTKDKFGLSGLAVLKYNSIEKRVVVMSNRTAKSSDNQKITPALSRDKGGDLEIKDAQLIFQHIWGELVKKHGESCLRFPREIIWLGGAPGSGKGTNIHFRGN